MTLAYIVSIGVAVVSALLTFVAIVIFAKWLFNLFRPAIPPQTKIHDTLLMAVYAMFPLQAVNNYQAVAGAAVTPLTLVAISATQTILFGIWAYLRLTKSRAPQWVTILVAAPGMIPAVSTLIWLLALISRNRN